MKKIGLDFAVNQYICSQFTVMKILISPAKSMDEQGSFPETDFTTPVFVKEAASLSKKLKKMKPSKLMELMHISAAIADLNARRYKNWYLSDTPTEEVRPAGYLFAGDVYRGLKFPDFTAAEVEKAQDRLRILSGMYGLLRPKDLIFPYRLEMGTKWEIDAKNKNLYEFWGNKLTKFLQKETAKDELLVNLASNEYAKAIQWKNMKRPVITPTFREFRDGEFKVIAIFAKHARGAMARYLIQHDIHSAEELKAYDVDGYSFDAKESTDTELVFVR